MLSKLSTCQILLIQDIETTFFFQDIENNSFDKKFDSNSCKTDLMKRLVPDSFWLYNTTLLRYQKLYIYYIIIYNIYLCIFIVIVHPACSSPFWHITVTITYRRHRFLIIITARCGGWWFRLGASAFSPTRATSSESTPR